jgi:hypothetical protein
MLGLEQGTRGAVRVRSTLGWSLFVHFLTFLSAYRLDLTEEGGKRRVVRRFAFP